MRKQALQLLRQGTVIPANPLALTAQRTLDEKRQRLLMRYYLEAGAGGIATAVHSTQFAIRRPEIGLFEPLLKLVAEEIGGYEARTGRTVLRIAGACGPTGQAVAEAELAKSLHYDAVLLSPAGLAEYSEEQLLQRTIAVGRVLPVIAFYIQPAVGGRRLSFAYWQQLAGLECVCAIKVAPFNRYMTLDVLRAVALSPRREEIALYTGNDDNIVADLVTPYTLAGPNGQPVTLRFCGGLLGHWSVWTHAVVQLFPKLQGAAKGGGVAKDILRLAAEVTDCNAAVFDVANGFAGCIPGLHYVLQRQGLLAGTWCLDKSEVLSPGQAGEIDRVCAAYPHLVDDAFVRQNLSRWKAEVKL